jgi:uncharacterized repeat protein (TIGR03803 family)
LIQAKDGKLYGISNASTLFDPATLYTIPRTGGAPTVRFIFPTDAIPVEAPVIQGKTGDLYGTSAYSFSGSNRGFIYRIKTNGANFKVLHTFTGKPDGAFPRTGLTQIKNGTLYGTTIQGGSKDFGSVFQISPTGTNYKVLYSFKGGLSGSTPYARLTVGKDGALYGSTASGPGTCPGNLLGTTASGCGSIFKLTVAGVWSRIFAFNNTKGAYPLGQLVETTKGTFFGTTYQGGANGLGTVFKLSNP